MNKTALDKKAIDYWTEYFKQYGEMWVRDIPRRLKQAVRREASAKTIDGDIAPLAKNVATDGTLSIEAAFVGKIDDKNAKLLITAEFEPNGKLNKIETTRVS